MKFEIMLEDIKIIEKKLDIKDECVTFFGSARFSDDNEYCINAYKLSQKLANSGFTIVTGGGGGIMKAANKGAFEVENAKSIGINAILPNEQATNEYVNNAMLFSTLPLRKVALIKNSKYFVVFPGGYGTLDELFEILVLKQCKHKKAKVFLFGTEFWTPLIEFLKISLIKNNAIKEDELEIFTMSDDIEFIYNQITSN